MTAAERAELRELAEAQAAVPERDRVSFGCGAVLALLDALDTAETTLADCTAERDNYRGAVETLRGERDEARTTIGAIEYADEEIRRQYGAEFGLLDPDDSPPCWEDFAKHIRALTRERDEARAMAPRWVQQQSACYRLLCGKACLGAIEVYDDDSAAWWEGDWFNGKRNLAATLEDAARAVCVRLGLPYIEVPNAD